MVFIADLRLDLWKTWNMTNELWQKYIYWLVCWHTQGRERKLPVFTHTHTHTHTQANFHLAVHPHWELSVGLSSEQQQESYGVHPASMSVDQAPSIWSQHYGPEESAPSSLKCSVCRQWDKYLLPVTFTCVRWFYSRDGGKKSAFQK